MTSKLSCLSLCSDLFSELDLLYNWWSVSCICCFLVRVLSFYWWIVETTMMELRFYRSTFIGVVGLPFFCLFLLQFSTTSAGKWNIELNISVVTLMIWLLYNEGNLRIMLWLSIWRYSAESPFSSCCCVVALEYSFPYGEKLEMECRNDASMYSQSW